MQFINIILSEHTIDSSRMRCKTQHVFDRHHFCDWQAGGELAANPLVLAAENANLVPCGSISKPVRSLFSIAVFFPPM